MANPILRIILSAVDNVSDPARKAEGGLDSVGKRIGTLAKTVAAFVAGSALAGFFKASVDAAVEFEKSQNRLIATSKLTGVALEDLRAVSDRGQKMFGLSANLANDFAIELAKLASKAGDVGKAGPAMQAFLDIGAARGLSAAETLKAVQQAILGIDEGTDKLFNKNPSVLYAEYAAAIGTTAGKLTDQQKAQALLNAALEDGAVVQGEYQKYLGTFGGALDALKNRWESLKIAVGSAVLASGDMGSATSMLSDSLGSLVTWVEENESGFRVLGQAAVATMELAVKAAGKIGEFIGGLQLLAADAAALWLSIPPRIQGAIGRIKQHFGEFIAGNRLILTIFGDSATKVGEEMANAGVKMQREATRSMGFIQQAHDEMYAEILGTTQKATEKEVAIVTTAATKKTTVTAEETEKRKKEAEDHAKWIEGIEAKQLDAYIAKQKKISEEPKFWEQIRLSVAAINQQHEWANQQLAEGNNELRTSVGHARALVAEADKEAAEQERSAKAKKESQQKLEETVGNAADLGRSFLDIAQSTGLIDRDMGSVVNSVINIGTSLAKIGIDPLGGMIGVISGLANVITGFGNSEAHKRYVETMNRNRDAVDRLTREVGNLNLGATGRTFAGTQSAVDATLAAMQAGQFTGRTHGERSAKALDFFKKQLINQGVSVADARQMLEDLGFGDVLSSGTTFFSSLGALDSGLGAVEFGQYGQDFDSQLQALEDSFGVFGTEDDEAKLAGYGQLARRFSPALAAALNASDPKAALQGLFSQLVNGGLTPADFGQLSGNQFRDLLKLLIPLMGEGTAAGAGTGGYVIGSSSDGGQLPVSPVALGDIGSVIAPDLGAALPAIGGGFPVGGGGQQIDMQVGPIYIGLPAGLSGDPKSDGRLLSETIVATIEANGDAITRIIMRRAGDEYERQRAAQGLS